MSEVVEEQKQTRELLVDYERCQGAQSGIGTEERMAEKDTARLEKEEKALITELLQMEKQKEALDAEMQQLDVEEQAVEAEENEYVTLHLHTRRFATLLTLCVAYCPLGSGRLTRSTSPSNTFK